MDYRKRLAEEFSIVEELYDWVCGEIALDPKDLIQNLYNMMKDDIAQYGKDDCEDIESVIDNAEMLKNLWEKGGVRFHVDTSRSERDKDVEILSGMCSAYRDVIRLLKEDKPRVEPIT